MAEELAYALVTPYSLLKSRTGGIIGRLLSLAHLELVACRMYRPSDEFVDRYLASAGRYDGSPAVQEAWTRYVDTQLRADNPMGISNRCLLLLFQGEDAWRHLFHDVIGRMEIEPRGDTVGGTYGDLVLDRDGRVVFFEPACLTAPNATANREHLELLAEFARRDGGIHEEHIRKRFPAGATVQTTLVMLKPENFERRSRRPGNIIDIFSRTGLYLSAAKLFRMSPAQGQEFYGPLRELFRDRLRGKIAAAIKSALTDVFAFTISDETYDQMAGMLAGANADYELRKIVEYMTGVDPASALTEQERNAGGRTRCLALLYTGVDAVEKIRRWLGSTDPSKAAPGTVRSDFGRDLMQNGAHASDSVENAERERKIIGLWTDDGISAVEEYVGRLVR